MGTTRQISPMVGMLCLVLVASGCLSPMTNVGADGTDANPVNATAHGDNGDGTYAAPEVPAGSTVYVAHSEPFSAFNNTASALRSTDNTLVLNQVLVDPFIIDGNGSVLLNSDVLVSAELTSRDPQTVTYRIRSGITWSDGAPWDCDDFYLAWLARSGTVTMPTHSATAQSAKAQCSDSLTFIETYAEPDVEWRRTYTQNAILPAHILERETGISDITEITSDSPQQELRTVAHFWNNAWAGFTAETMPASGPYRIDSADPAGSTVLVRNERWAGNPGGPERIVFVPVADSTAALEGLISGDLTIVAPPADATLAAKLRALSAQGVVFASHGGAGTKNLDLNLARPLFRHPEVRVALAQCVDRNMLVEDLVRGIIPVAQPQGSLAFLPGSPGYADHYSQLMRADSRQAQLTLERAGWILGPDGIYARDGQRLSFTISHEDSARHSRVVELVRTQCRQAGMEILAEGADGPLDELLATGSFDVALVDVALVAPVSSMADRYVRGADQNYQRYANPEVDAALAEAQQEFSESARVKAIRKADKLIADDVVSLPLFQDPLMWAHRDNVENVFVHGTDGVSWNANEWVVR